MGPVVLERHEVCVRECTRIAGLVDVATGKVVFTQCDAGSPIPFARIWTSASTYRGPLGHGWHHGYDLALAPGASVAVLRTADGRVVWFSMPSPARETYAPEARLVLARDGYGFMIRDAAHRELRFAQHRAQAAFVLASVRSSRGAELRFAYDHRARLVHVTRRGGVGLELDYDGEDRLVELRGPQLLAAFTYDAQGNLSEARDRSGRARSYAYAGQLLSACVDRDGRTTRFDWSGRDARASCTRVSVGVQYTLEYAKGRTRVAGPDGRVTSYAHDGALVHRTLDACGGAREVMRDSNRNIEVIVDALGERTHFGYDSRGRLCETRRADGAVARFEYDGSGRLRKAIDLLGGTWELAYDAHRRVVRLVDPLGCVTRFEYRGRWLTSVVDATGAVTRFAYDEAGRIRSSTRDGAVTQFSYDRAGLLACVRGADAVRELRSYDSLGGLVRVNEVELSYDGEGRLLGARSAADGGMRFEYDDQARLIGVLNEEGARYRIARDAAGRVTETEGFEGCTRSYARDLAGRVVRLARAAAFCEYERDAVGRVIETQYSDGDFEGYCYRADGALMAAWNRVITLTFARDALGRLLREYQGEHFVEYFYDRAGVPVELRSSFGAEQRVDVGVDRGMDQQAAPSSARASSNERTCTLDAAGNVTSRRDAAGRWWHYRWSVRGLLSCVVDPEEDEVSFAYDAFGRRVWKKYRGQTTRWVWAGSRILHEWVEGGVPTLREETRKRAPALAAMLEAPAATRGTRDAPLTWPADPRCCPMRAKLAACAYEDLETELYCVGPQSRYFDPVSSRFLCPGSLAAPPSLRPYELSPRALLAVAEPQPAHAWFSPAPSAALAPLQQELAKLLPPVPYPILARAGLPIPQPALQLLAADAAEGTGTLVEGMLRRAFELLCG